MNFADHQRALREAPARGWAPEIRVWCRACHHAWVAAYLPMETDKVVRLCRGLCCPKCGAASEAIMFGNPPVAVQTKEST